MMYLDNKILLQSSVSMLIQSDLAGLPEAV